MNSRKVASYSRKKIHKQSSVKNHSIEKTKFLKSILAHKKKFNEFVKDIKICLSKVKNQETKKAVEKKLDKIKNLKKYPKKKLIDYKFKIFDLYDKSYHRNQTSKIKSKDKIRNLKNSKYHKRGISHHNETTKLLNEENCIKKQISLLKNLKRDIIKEYKKEIQTRIKIISKTNKENISKDKKRNQIFHLILFENKSKFPKENNREAKKTKKIKELPKKNFSQSKKIKFQKEYKMKKLQLSLNKKKYINPKLR